MRRRRITWAVLGVLALAGLGVGALALQHDHEQQIRAVEAAARSHGCSQVERRGDLLIVRARSKETTCISGAVAAAGVVAMTYVDLARAQRVEVKGRRATLTADPYGDGWAYVFRVR